MNIRILEPNDVTQSYIDWMLDKEVVKYSENQYKLFTLEKQKMYVQDCFLNKNIDLYGIFLNEEHIGNISLKDLSSPHKRAEITYLIGKKNYWNKGLGSKLISIIIEKAREEYQLKKLYAGVAKENISSQKVLEKNNFKLEGIRENHLFLNNVFMDQMDYGLIL